MKNNIRSQINNFLHNHGHFIIAFLLILWAFKRWFGQGMITWGDWWPETIDVYLGWLKPHLWSNTKELGGSLLNELSAPVWIPSFTLAGWLAYLFNMKYELIEKIIWYWPYIIIAPISFYYFWRTFFPKNGAGALAGILFFSINTYSMLLTMGGQVNLAIVYALIPAILATLKKYVEIKNIRTGIILGLLVTLAITYEVRGVMLLTVLVLSFLLFFWKKIGLKTIFTSLGWYFLIPITLNMWWIAPFIFQKKTELLPATYDQVKWVVESSYADLAHAMTLFHPQWFDNVLGKINPVPPLFFLIPLILISAIIWSRKEPFIRFFTLIALVSIFLVKGANAPLGQIYIELFEYLPGFSAFRDPSKFNVFLAFAYSVLFAYLVDRVYQLMSSKKIWRISVFSILSIMPLIWLWPVYHQQIEGTFNLITEPTLAYRQLTEKLIQDQRFSRTMWLPKKQRFAYFSELHPQISLDSAIHNSLHFLKNSARETQDALTHRLSQYLLQDAGVKYVIVPDDDTRDIYKDYHPKEFYLNIADNTAWLTKRKDFSLNVYELSGVENIIYVRNHWIYTNSFDSDLMVDYLLQQKEKLGLILTNLENPLETDKLTKTMPYLFNINIPDPQELIAQSKDLTNQNTIENIKQIDLNIVRAEPSTLFILKDNLVSFEWLKIDNDFINLETKVTSRWNPDYYEVQIPAYQKGKHLLLIKIKTGDNLFAGGEIGTDFDPQSRYCVPIAREEILSNTSTAPGAFDGGQFLKMRSYANLSCFARFITLPVNKQNYHLEFDYQYKYGEQARIKIVESNGASHTINLKDFYAKPENQSNHWHHIDQSISLSEETDTVMVSFEILPALNINQDGPSESWFDNIKFFANNANSQNFIQYGKLFPIDGNQKPTQVAINKKSSDEFEAMISGAQNPQLVVLNTMHNPDWIAQVAGGTVSKSTETNGFANGFIISNQKNSYTIDFKFALKSWLSIGFIISITSLLILIIVFAISKFNLYEKQIS